MTTTNIHRPIPKVLVEAYGLGEYWEYFEGRDASASSCCKIHQFVDVSVTFAGFILKVFNSGKKKQARILCNKINDMLSEARNAPVTMRKDLEDYVHNNPQFNKRWDRFRDFKSVDLGSNNWVIKGKTPQAKLFLQQFTLEGEMIDEKNT